MSLHIQREGCFWGTKGTSGQQVTLHSVALSLLSLLGCSQEVDLGLGLPGYTTGILSAYCPEDGTASSPSIQRPLCSRREGLLSEGKKAFSFPISQQDTLSTP